MRFALAPIAAAALLAGCSGAGPTPQEEALPETGQEPEVTANAAAAGVGNASTATGPADGEAPGGPVSDTGSAQGDTAPSL